MQKKKHAELTAIFIAAGLLIVSLAGIGEKAAAAHKASGRERYPGLWVEHTAEIVCPEQKTAYYTFDDGPSRNTEKILDVLAEENVKATFFVCAQQYDGVDSPALLRRIVEEGHEIGLHTYSHDYSKVYRSLDDYLEDLNAVNDYIVEATGYHPEIVRFPGGSGSVNAGRELMKQIIGEVRRRGYRYYDWDVESGDSGAKVNSAGYLCEKIVNGAKDRERLIILLHDSPGPKTSAEAVRLSIPILREKGYAFDRLTSCVDPEKRYN